MLSNIGQGLLAGGQSFAQQIANTQSQDFSSEDNQGYLARLTDMTHLNTPSIKDSIGQLPVPFSDVGPYQTQPSPAPQGMLPGNQPPQIPVGPSNLAANQALDTNKLRMSPMGQKTLILSEGLKTKPYKDSQDNWTVGIGHLITDPKEKRNYTPEEVQNLFKQDLAKYEDAVSSSIKTPLTQNEYDSLVHFAFNVGEGAFKKSTLVKKLNAGDKEGAAQEFMKWTKQPELASRRKLEQAIFLGRKI